MAVQIETRGALEEVAEIAALPGVDVLFLGPYDLGHALGLPPGPESEEMQATAQAVATAAHEAGTVYAACSRCACQAAASLMSSRPLARRTSR